MFHLYLGKGFLYNPFGENQLMEKKAAIKIFHSNLKQSLTYVLYMFYLHSKSCQCDTKHQNDYNMRVFFENHENVQINILN